MAVDHTLPYDPQNIFARILRGEIPCKKVYEDAYVLAFHDINAQAPIHILVLPKGAYISFADFSETAPDVEILAFNRAVGRVADEAGAREGGYRIVANHGKASHQEVPHFHVHILAGRELGPLLVPAA